MKGRMGVLWDQPAISENEYVENHLLTFNQSIYKDNLLSVILILYENLKKKKAQEALYLVLS